MRGFARSVLTQEIVAREEAGARTWHMLRSQDSGSTSPFSSAVFSTDLFNHRWHGYDPDKDSERSMHSIRYSSVLSVVKWIGSWRLERRGVSCRRFMPDPWFRAVGTDARHRGAEEAGSRTWHMLRSQNSGSTSSFSSAVFSTDLFNHRGHGCDPDKDSERSMHSIRYLSGLSVVNQSHRGRGCSRRGVASVVFV